MKKTPDDVELKVCELYDENLTCMKIGEMLNLSNTTVGDILKRYGYEIRSTKHYTRVYSLDESYFSKIDNEHKAYWLGFLAADGYNNEKYGFIKIALNGNDFNHIDKFKADIQYTGRTIRLITSQNHDVVRVCVSSRTMSDDLVKLNIVQGKSFTVDISDKIPEYLIRHFIRGYFDGDGGFNFYEKRPGNTTFHITGNSLMINSIQDYLVLKLNLQKTQFYQRFKDCEVYTMRYCGNPQVSKIIKFLYSGSTVSMDRKFVTAEKIMSFDGKLKVFDKTFKLK